MRFLKLYTRIFVATWTKFGPLQSLRTLRILIFSGFVHLCMALDHIVYPAFRKVEVKAPIFIIGHPRSGTTFLHRLLADCGDFATFRLWEILLPSLVARRLLGPVVVPLGRAFRSAFHNKAGGFARSGHLTGELEVEEEELLLLSRLETQFISLMSALAFEEEGKPMLQFDDMLPRADRQGATRFLRSCFQRHLFVTGRTQIVAKMPYSTLRIKALMEEFPDAKFIYLVRSPLETIPSHLSLHFTFLTNRWGWDNLSREDLFRYFNRRYQANVALYRYVEELKSRGELPAERFKVVVYDELRHNLEQTLKDLVKFGNLSISENGRRRIREEALNQPSYRRRHLNRPLEDFGLSEERVVKDLECVFKRYGFGAHSIMRPGHPRRDYATKTTTRSLRPVRLPRIEMSEVV